LIRETQRVFAAAGKLAAARKKGGTTDIGFRGRMAQTRA
jgi:hypothetical protein